MEPVELKRLLTSFSLSASVCARYVGMDGAIIAPDEPGASCSFCDAMQQSRAGRERCVAAMQAGARESARFGEPYVMRCHAGAVEIVSAVIDAGQLAGGVCCGPLFMWEWDALAATELSERTEGLDVPAHALAEAARGARVLDARSVRAISDMLHVLVGHIAHTGEEMLRQRKAISEQQALIWELVMSQQGTGVPVYPLEMERRLMELVRCGDRAGAKRILNQLLGRVFYATADVAVIKARVLELVVMLSRSAVEVGASLNVLLGMNYHFISELSELVSFEDVCAWVVKVLDSFLDASLESRASMKTEHVLERAMAVVRGRFSENLTLDKVAQSVHISPFYLSHLLKEKHGFTFIEYLTRVRIDEAKMLLSGTGRSIRQVAADVGYVDAGYFTKVFKKMVGTTPGEYREKNATL